MNKTSLNTILNSSVKSDAITFLIYAVKGTNRLNYVCEFIFNTVLNINYKITSEINEFEKATGFKINYSDKSFSEAVHILPADLMLETGVSEKKPTSELKNNFLYFFSTGNGTSFHFDIFSAVFYFISRYEEWQKFEPDQHGRFELKESILFNPDSHRDDFHLKPVVEIWIDELKNELLQKYINLKFPEKKFKSIATIDVDNLYAYKNKGLFRTIGAGLKDLIKFDFANLMRRNRVINNVEQDPFDIYDSFSSFCNEHKIPLFFFFLLKSGTKFDRTVNPSSKAFDTVFKILKKNNSHVGLHPSYFSSVNTAELNSEAKIISNKLGNEVQFSRQHYLKFNIKTTPGQLMQNNIVTDFSMGFASGAGFRAGTCHPFYYYDFNSESKKDLLFVPFCAKVRS